MTAGDGKTQQNRETRSSWGNPLPKRMQTFIREGWKNIATSSEKEHLEKEMFYIYVLEYIQVEKTYKFKYRRSRKDCGAG